MGTHADRRCYSAAVWPEHRKQLQQAEQRARADCEQQYRQLVVQPPSIGCANSAGQETCRNQLVAQCSQQQQQLEELKATTELQVMVAAAAQV